MLECKFQDFPQQRSRVFAVNSIRVLISIDPGIVLHKQQLRCIDGYFGGEGVSISSGGMLFASIVH